MPAMRAASVRLRISVRRAKSRFDMTHRPPLSFVRPVPEPGSAAPAILANPVAGRSRGE
jgi:hypothetical protein